MSPVRITHPFESTTAAGDVPLQPPRSSFSCYRHHDDNFTGFCPSCLSERLTIIDQSATASSSSITTAAVKSICRAPLSNAPADLRRTKSCSRLDYENKPDEEIKVSEHEQISNSSDLEKDILEMEAKIDAIVDNLKSMHNNIDSKNPSSSNFWSPAGKKLQKWRLKPKNKLPATKSEVADYGFGRRSCDTDPRFSLDAGRVSFDVPVVKLTRSAPVEEAEGNIPGGSTQTREYYLKKKKGVERSSSMRTTINNNNNNNNNQNAKVSPASIDYNHSHRRLKFQSIGGEKELERDDGSESLVKKTRWWNWKVKIWGNHSNRKLSRSSSSVSWRNTVEAGKNRHQGDVNNGFLRFYLPPLRGSRNRNLKK